MKSVTCRHNGRKAVLRSLKSADLRGTPKKKNPSQILNLVPPTAGGPSNDGDDNYKHYTKDPNLFIRRALIFIVDKHE